VPRAECSDRVTLKQLSLREDVQPIRVSTEEDIRDRTDSRRAAASPRSVRCTALRIVVARILLCRSPCHREIF